jgi:hypothetical protein
MKKLSVGPCAIYINAPAATGIFLGVWLAGPRLKVMAAALPLYTREMRFENALLVTTFGDPTPRN